MKTKPAKTFKDLLVWEKAHHLVLNIYKETRKLPEEEKFGLTSQIRRAAVSIPANIVEGFTRKSDTEKLRFYNISQGSLEEVRYYLILINDLGFFSTQDLLALIEEVSKVLNAYCRSIENKRK